MAAARLAGRTVMGPSDSDIAEEMKEAAEQAVPDSEPLPPPPWWT